MVMAYRMNPITAPTQWGLKTIMAALLMILSWTRMATGFPIWEIVVSMMLVQLRMAAARFQQTMQMVTVYPMNQMAAHLMLAQ